jgi:hypothetical protein
MSFEQIGNDSGESNKSRNARRIYHTAADRQKIEIGAKAILRANQIQSEIDERERRFIQQKKLDSVGVYTERRSALMLISSVILIAGLSLLLGLLVIVMSWANQSFVTDSALQTGYSDQIQWCTIAGVVLLAWLSVHRYMLWSMDYLMVDLQRIRRFRKAVWYFGVTKIDFQAPTHSATCEETQSVLQEFLMKFGIKASTVTIDTEKQRDEIVHDMTYVKNAEHLAMIINA